MGRQEDIELRLADCSTYAERAGLAGLALVIESLGARALPNVRVDDDGVYLTHGFTDAEYGALTHAATEFAPLGKTGASHLLLTPLNSLWPKGATDPRRMTKANASDRMIQGSLPRARALVPEFGAFIQNATYVGEKSGPASGGYKDASGNGSTVCGTPKLDENGRGLNVKARTAFVSLFVPFAALEFSQGKTTYVAIPVVVGSILDYAGAFKHVLRNLPEKAEYTGSPAQAGLAALHLCMKARASDMAAEVQSCVAGFQVVTLTKAGVVDLRTFVPSHADYLSAYERARKVSHWGLRGLLVSNALANREWWEGVTPLLQRAQAEDRQYVIRALSTIMPNPDRDPLAKHVSAIISKYRRGRSAHDAQREGDRVSRMSPVAAVERLSKHFLRVVDHSLPQAVTDTLCAARSNLKLAREIQFLMYTNLYRAAYSHET